jgi:hypothetical protein
VPRAKGTGPATADAVNEAHTDQLGGVIGAEPNGTDTSRQSVPSDQGAALLNDVRDFLARFIVYPSLHAHIAHVLWIAHAHLMEAWESTPRIAFLSPEPASGKTRALEASGLLVPLPVEAINVTPAYLFRKVGSEQGLPTILYDEIDTVFGAKAKDNEEVRALLNAGHRKGAVAGRCVVHGATVLTEEIPAYCAVALAGLGWLPDTILSRSIVIKMRRRAAGERIEPFRRRVHAEQGHAIRDRLAGWAKIILEEATDARPEMPFGVDDRNADIWESLLAIADIAGSAWPERARAAATALVKIKDEEPSLGIRLLADLKTVFGDADQMTTADILPALAALDEAPWCDIEGRGKPLDARGLGNHLRPYGVRSKNIVVGATRPKGYARADLHDAWIRYLPPQPATSATAATSATIPDTVADVADVADFLEDEGEASEFYPPVCVHCGEPQDQPDNPVQECWVDEGESYWLHRECQRDWLDRQDQPDSAASEDDLSIPFFLRRASHD